MKRAINTMAKWQYILAERHIPDLVVYGLSGFTILLGVVFISTPERFEKAPTFDAVFHLAGPELWGVAFIITSLFLAHGFWSTRTGGRQAALILVILYTAFASLSTVTPFGGEGVFSAGVIYGFLAYSSLLALICSTIPKDLP